MTSTLQSEADELTLALPTEMAMDITKKIAQAWKAAMDKPIEKVVLLCDSRIRAPLAAMLERTVPPLPVIAYDEIVLGTDVEPVETISCNQTQNTAPRQQELVGAPRS
jgi:flagellar biosynthesis component FlhA